MLQPSTLVDRLNSCWAALATSPASSIRRPGRKYGYSTNRSNSPDAGQWLADAEQHAGSWWLHWSQWLAAFGEEQVAARSVGGNKYPPLMDAPGSYVLAAHDARFAGPSSRRRRAPAEIAACRRASAPS